MLFAQPESAFNLSPTLMLLLVGVALLAVVGKLFDARARTRRVEVRKQRQREYRQYLRSDGWKSRRQVALDRAGGFCEDCGVRSNFEVHHKTYKRKGNERPEDLVAVCRDCHKERHGGNRTLLDVIALALLRRWRVWRYRSAETQ